MPAWPPETERGDARFRRRSRLTTKADFHRVFEQPEKSTDSCFTVLARPNELGFPRLGLAISRKSAKSAVARNTIKRVVRESFRRHQQELGSVDIVIVGRAKLDKQDNATVFGSLRKHWVRIARRCARS